MATKDFYVILGVRRDATPRGIRKAYLDAVKRHHPDRIGEAGTATFQDIQEAYETLSDPERRREHDYRLNEAGRSFLRRARRPGAVVSEPISILSQPASIHPSFEALFERLLRNFTGIRVPKGERLEDLNIEVILSPEEAARGVTVPIEVPTFHRCPFCDGTGRDWVFPCTYCREEGYVEKPETVRVEVPPNVGPGTLYEIPLQGLGVHNFYLRLHIFLE
jgi:DnaJ-class molecular chaperone